MPEVRVQVLYDFEYTTKEGREIWMKEGERLYLIQKTNEDWWQVLRNSERRPFYVPAAYVEEVQPKKTKTSFRSSRLNEVRLEPKALTKNYRARDDRYDELGSAPYGKRLSEEEDPIYDNECFLVSLSQGDITCRGMKEKRTPQFRREHLAENWEHRSEKSRRAEGHSIETLDHRPPRQVSLATGKRAVRRGGEGYGRRSDGLMGNSTARLDDGTKHDAEQRQNKPLPLIFHNLAYEGDLEDAEEMKENDSEHHEDITEDLDEVAAHSTSTLLAPTTALPRLRPPSSPLRTRSSPSTPTLATASTHRPHSPAPSSSAPSSASSSPTSVTTPTLFSIPVPTGGSFKSGSSSHQPPPSPSPHQPPVRHLSNGWVEYCDASGRTFFYNGDSGEKSWKPPRRRIRKEEPGDGSRSCSSSPLADGEDTTSRAIQIPSGWRESYDSSAEQTCFVNVVTGAKWYSSNDAEGRVYYFEENSHESSWTLPEVSITSPSQTPPLAGISASPMGSDSFISGRSSGGEEGLGANGHEEIDRDGGPSFVLKGEPPMPKVKERQKEWEKASGGRLIQLRENTDKDRGMRNSARNTKTRSMILMDPISGEIKMPSCGKNLKDWPELWDGNMCILKEGTLNRTKITENGKKVRKNWASSHVVLTELFLLFFKDAKTFAATKAGNSGGNSSNEPAASPELCVDLSGASIERGDHLSSRRNVFLVTAILGLQVLCQDDNSQNSDSWYMEISKAIHQLPSAVDGSPRQNTLDRQTCIEAHSPDEHKKFPRIGRSKSVKVKKDASMEDLSVTEKQVKIRARLKKFFHRRPTMESLVKKGIWKDEPAFGCYLDQVSGEGKPRLPLFVQRCIAAIEAKPENMKADGLYRASGNLSQVQKIRLQVDQYNLDILDVEEDVHVLTGALKLFFRELKEPLIPFSLFTKALSASTNPNRKEQLSEFRELVKSLPTANYDTLKFLLQHLLRVTSFQEFNRMHIANLAIVFGPTLMWPEQESLNMALDLMQQNLVIECLLQEFDSIFSSGR